MFLILQNSFSKAKFGCILLVLKWETRMEKSPCPEDKGPGTQGVNILAPHKHLTPLAQSALQHKICRACSSHTDKKFPGNLRLLIYRGWAAGCWKERQFSRDSLPEHKSKCLMQDSHFTQVCVWFGLFPGDWLSFPGFGRARKSQSLPSYLSLRPNWTNARKHVFQVYLCHSGRRLCVRCRERRETAESPADHTQGAPGVAGWPGCKGPRSAPAKLSALSAIRTAPPHSPVPREGILRKKKEPGSLETLN